MAKNGRPSKAKEHKYLQHASYRDGEFDIHAFNRAWAKMHGPSNNPTKSTDNAAKQHNKRKDAKR